jgi:hypothetical protein
MSDTPPVRRPDPDAGTLGSEPLGTGTLGGEPPVLNIQKPKGEYPPVDRPQEREP